MRCAYRGERLKLQSGMGEANAGEARSPSSAHARLAAAPFLHRRVGAAFARVREIFAEQRDVDLPPGRERFIQPPSIFFYRHSTATFGMDVVIPC